MVSGDPTWNTPSVPRGQGWQEQKVGLSGFLAAPRGVLGPGLCRDPGPSFRVCANQKPCEEVDSHLGFVRFCSGRGWGGSGLLDLSGLSINYVLGKASPVFCPARAIELCVPGSVLPGMV